MSGVLSLVVSLLCLLAPPDDAAPKDLTLMQGTWRIARLELGEAAPTPPEEEIKKGRLIIQGTKITARMGGQDQEPETFTLDPSKNPKTIDMTTTMYSRTLGPNGTEEAKKTKGKMQGIYKIDGDRLTLCFTDADRPNAASKDRPTEFSVQGQTNRFLLVLERDKEDKK